MKKILKTLVFLLFIFALLPQNVGAGIIDSELGADITKQDTSLNDKAKFGDSTIAGTVATVITAFLSLLGIIFTLLILYSGFLWMTAGGDSDQVQKAKQGISRSIIGIVILMSAYSIMFFVFRYVLD